jgi:hypothetical protein
MEIAGLSTSMFLTRCGLGPVSQGCRRCLVEYHFAKKDSLEKGDSTPYPPHTFRGKVLSGRGLKVDLRLYPVCTVDGAAGFSVHIRFIKVMTDWVENSPPAVMEARTKMLKKEKVLAL